VDLTEHFRVSFFVTHGQSYMYIRSVDERFEQLKQFRQNLGFFSISPNERGDKHERTQCQTLEQLLPSRNTV